MRSFLEHLVAVSLHWMIAYHALVAWWWPVTKRRKEWVKHGLSIIILEMILLVMTLLSLEMISKRFSTVFTGHFFMVALFNLFFVGIIALAFKNGRLILDFLCLIGFRVFRFASTSSGDHKLLLHHFMLALITYMLTVFVTSFFPIPVGGLTTEIKRAIQLPGSGLWVEHPERALAAVLIYFFSMGILELIPNDIIRSAFN